MRIDEIKFKIDNKNDVLSRSFIKLKIVICYGCKLIVVIFDNEIFYKKVELEVLVSCDFVFEFKIDFFVKENVYVSVS